jgi:hypothetical protein
MMSIMELPDHTRSRIRGLSWTMIAACIVTLGAIFGMGAATGAGNYFDDDPTVVAAAIAEHNLEIWILLVGVGLGLFILGVALYVLGGVLAEMGSGRRATVASVVRWAPLLAGVLGLVVYLRGPSTEESFLEAFFIVPFALTCVAFITYGVLMIMVGLPRWMGIVAILVGGLLPWLGLLPLWWFVAGVPLAVGLLRLVRRSRAAAPAGVATY